MATSTSSLFRRRAAFRRGLQLQVYAVRLGDLASNGKNRLAQKPVTRESGNLRYTVFLKDGTTLRVWSISTVVASSSVVKTMRIYARAVIGELLRGKI